jgi:hypothetical protein
LPKTLIGVSRKNDEYTEDGKCGDLHGSLASKATAIYLMSRASVTDIQVVLANLP